MAMSVIREYIPAANAGSAITPKRSVLVTDLIITGAKKKSRLNSKYVLSSGKYASAFNRWNCGKF